VDPLGEIVDETVVHALLGRLVHASMARVYPRL
jgi:hypothetical protein